MGWEQIKISHGDTNLFCNVHIANKTAMNIIVTHTPIVTTLDMQQAYQPFENYGVNVFAFDFSGTGNSSGAEKTFSRKSIVNDLDIIANYVESNFSSNIHLYGNAGIGGMFAQYYASKSSKVKSFAQFACVHYKNTTGMGYPYSLAKILCLFLKALPNIHVRMKPPKYEGYNQEKDNAVYKMLETNHPNIWWTSSKMLQTMLECFVATDSEVKNGVSIPTLVFKTLHDRYFSPPYFDDYFKSLTCEKRLIEINDVHNSYYFDSEQFCKYAYEWFLGHS